MASRGRAPSRTLAGDAPVPVADSFVVHVEAEREPAVRAALTPFGPLEGLGQPGLLLFTVARGASPDPHEGWRRIVAMAADCDWSTPVLRDPRGDLHFPTGEVTVRFAQPPSDREVEAFAARHALRGGRRNEFVAAQVAFRPVDPRSTYLPDLVDVLAGLSGVAAVWANTLSRYRRA
jgi:hypothetical protein